MTPWTNNLFLLGRLLLGGTLMFLFARLFLPALPSLFSAVTFMLSGYFIIYLNIAHLSVEVLTPGIFLAFELLLRKKSWAAVAGVAGMIFLGMAGGMPEIIVPDPGFRNAVLRLPDLVCARSSVSGCCPSAEIHYCGRSWLCAFRISPIAVP